MPLISIEAFRPNWLVDSGVVIMERDRVIAISAFAQAAGVQLGMRRSSVHMLLPDALFKQREIDQENAVLQTVSIALLQYSPQVAKAEQASILINIGASLSLFGGVRKLCRLVMQTMATLGITATLGCAATARGAWLLAHTATTRRGRYCLSLHKLTRHLDVLPVVLLPSAQPWLEWLQGIGCQHLGALRRLPRAGLQRRCGKALLDTLDCAYGEASELHQWLEVPPQFTARTELPDRIEHVEAILNFARSLLVQLNGWLSSKRLATAKIHLCLEHERGRLAIRPTQLDIALAEATWREEHLSRLLKEHLARLKLDAPVIAISLHATQLETMQTPTASLFPEPGSTQEEHHRLLELLVARLGAENVLQAAPQADYRPEVANCWISVMQVRKPLRLTTQASNMMNRPTWLLPQALALPMRQHRPCYGSPLKILSPAERIEAGWWNGQLVARDYFIAENAEYLRCWIYRERISPSQSQTDTDSDPVWYLHGLFG